MPVFLSVSFGLASLLAFAVGVTGGPQSPWIALRFLSMFVPAVAVAITTATTGKAPRIDWRRLPVRYVAPALLLIPTVMHLAMLPVTVAVEGHIPWEPWLAPGSDGLIHTPESRGWGALTRGELLGRLAVNAIVGVLVVSVLALFEEIGWRGWLLPRLARRLGVRAAVVVTSAVWGIWHIPFALGGLQSIEGMSSLHLAVTWPLGVFASGLVIGWFWIRTESIWVVALAHGALNNWGQYAYKFMQGPADGSAGTELGTGMLAVLLVGIVLLVWAPPSSGMHSPSPPEPIAQP